MIKLMFSFLLMGSSLLRVASLIRLERLTHFFHELQGQLPREPSSDRRSAFIRCRSISLEMVIKNRKASTPLNYGLQYVLFVLVEFCILSVFNLTRHDLYLTVSSRSSTAEFHLRATSSPRPKLQKKPVLGAVTRSFKGTD